MSRTPESILKNQMKAYLRTLDSPAAIIPVPGGAYGKRGSPDMIICYKGHLIAIEGKTYEGTQEDWQKLRQHQIEAAGGIYILGRDIEHIKDAIKKIDNLITQKTN